jgi:hypothetical protein
MILSTHSIVGSAISYGFRLHPVTAFFAGIVSHFIMDMLPHRDYELVSTAFHPEPVGRSARRKDIIGDFCKVGFDILLAFIIPLYFFSGGNMIAVFAGAIGGMLPDFFHVLHNRYPRGFLAKLFVFHAGIQNHITFERWHILGMVYQSMIMALALSIGIWLHSAIIN